MQGEKKQCDAVNMVVSRNYNVGLFKWKIKPPLPNFNDKKMAAHMHHARVFITDLEERSGAVYNFSFYSVQEWSSSVSLES